MLKSVVCLSAGLVAVASASFNLDDFVARILSADCNNTLVNNVTMLLDSNIAQHQVLSTVRPVILQDDPDTCPTQYSASCQGPYGCCCLPKLLGGAGVDIATFELHQSNLITNVALATAYIGAQLASAESMLRECVFDNLEALETQTEATASVVLSPLVVESTGWQFHYGQHHDCNSHSFNVEVVRSNPVPSAMLEASPFQV